LATIEELNALESAIATGALSARYQDASGQSRSLQYRSLEEMLRIRDGMRRELGLVPNKSQTRVLSAFKGLR
jgi:hypothetical protein